MTIAELDKLKEETTCIHFTGFDNEKCNAGVQYATVKRFGYSFWARALYPCIGCLHKRKVSWCEHYAAPAPDQLAQARKRLEQIIATKDAIALAAGRLTGIRGTINCVVCDQVFWYSVDLKGKMQGRCTTPDCVRFEK